MMASYFGGMSIAYSQVGACHALSLALLRARHPPRHRLLHHLRPAGGGVSRGARFREMMARHDIQLPRGLTKDLDDAAMNTMVNVALGLAPLWENCFGKDWQQVMTRERALELFRRM